MRIIPLLVAALSLSNCVRARPRASPANTQWTEQTVRHCESLTDTAPEPRLREELVRLQLPDSAAAVELALRALGGRVMNPKASVRVYTRAPNGILIAFDLVGREARDAQGTRDGTATVYVSPGRCVTLLGW